MDCGPQHVSHHLLGVLFFHLNKQCGGADYNGGRAAMGVGLRLHHSPDPDFSLHTVCKFIQEQQIVQLLLMQLKMLFLKTKLTPILRLGTLVL